MATRPATPSAASSESLVSLPLADMLYRRPSSQTCSIVDSPRCKDATYRPHALTSPIVCQNYLQAFIRDNYATSYHLTINKLPWTPKQQYEITVQRSGGGKTNSTVYTQKGCGNSVGM